MTGSQARDDCDLGGLLRRAAERHGERVFLECAGVSRTFAEADRAANRMANGLAALGAGPGAKIAIMAANSLAFVDAWLGAARAGAVTVPINTDYKGDILRYQLAKADVTHIVIDPQFLDRLHAVAHGLPALRHVVLTAPPAAAPRFASGGVEVSTLAGVMNAPDRDPGVAISPSDPVAINFTSGTTGPSKGVLASHAHVVTFARDWIRATDYGDGQAIYSCMPLFHAVASWLGVVPAMINGGRIAIAPRFSASGFWDEVRRARADVAHGIFSMVPILMKQPQRPDDAEQPARRFYFAKVDAEFERRFNCRIVEVYGATETGIVTMTPPGEPRRAGSCGKPNEATFEVMLANERDEAVATGEVGEVLVRPRRPFAMLTGYYNSAEATAEAFRNLWFHTGDNARADADGYLTFVDRKKDAIRRRGENISSSEVESVLNRHPAVLECAVVAVPSELGEDEVKAVVRLREGASMSAKELWAFSEEHMPRFWVPRFVEFRDELPKTPSQKIQKYLLRSGEAQGEVFDRERRRRRAGA
ncbi:MAG: ATP-dependent acyl-CoA ligase [Betaproteobacteria bacterium]|nr:ATP-dependent acyl-CoA ligase [Betaproteobacteria bacterium]